MSQINVSNLSFSYPGSYDNIFENVSFQLDTDWKLGFIGRNGRGKTTFMRLLMDELPYKGSITASVEFDYFPLEIKTPQLSACDMLSELYPDLELWQVMRELSLLEMEDELIFRPFSSLSHGEKTRVMLSMLFARENNFLLIDEPTNHLDVQARSAVENYLKSKKGFILISHDRTLLDNVIDHVLSINRADIQLQKGNFSTWQHNRELQDSFEIAKNDRLKTEINRLNDSARRSAQWSDKVEDTKHGSRNSGLRPDRGYLGARSADMMRRSKSTQARREKASEEKKGLLKNIEKAEKLKLSPLESPQKLILSAENLGVSYGGKAVFQNLSFELRRGERLAIIGSNGSGKSSLIKLINGGITDYSGNLSTGGSLKISYLPQDTAGISGSLTDFAEGRGLDKSLFLSVLRKLDLPRQQFEKDLSAFSQGQKKKVLLSASIMDSAHLYLWDEPLNFIDIISREQIEKLILEYKPSMIFIEHDRRFVENIATGQLIMSD